MRFVGRSSFSVGCCHCVGSVVGCFVSGCCEGRSC